MRRMNKLTRILISYIIVMMGVLVIALYSADSPAYPGHLALLRANGFWQEFELDSEHVQLLSSLLAAKRFLPVQIDFEYGEEIETIHCKLVGVQHVYLQLKFEGGTWTNASHTVFRGYELRGQVCNE